MKPKRKPSQTEMDAQAQGELEYQRGYARKQRAQLKKETVGKVLTQEQQRRLSAYERVAPEAKPSPSPPGQSAWKSLGEGLKRLYQHGKRVGAGAKQLGDLPEVMPGGKSKKGRK